MLETTYGAIALTANLLSCNIKLSNGSCLSYLQQWSSSLNLKGHAVLQIVQVSNHKANSFICTNRCTEGELMVFQLVIYRNLLRLVLAQSLYTHETLCGMVILNTFCASYVVFAFTLPPPNPTAIYNLSCPVTWLPPILILNLKKIDRHTIYCFSLAFQCVTNIRVKGSEPIQCFV